MRSIFESLYEKYHQDIFQFIFYMVKNREQTEDLVQEVYIKVLKSYEKFKGDSSEKTWLFSIARHVTIDFFRKQERKRKRLLEFFDWEKKGEQLKDQQPLPEEIAEKNEQIQILYEYLDRLTVDQRSVIILRFIQLMSIQETADILGWSISKVKTTQHRGMKVLQDLMADQRKEGDSYEPK
ncbi:ECF RNA polymerase sigma factor SigX [Thalassobacillus devorans]|uniref:RNA polymerase sigma factor n=1 Tax=Thalassobacillus devorans TaxID=279813 RepID=A0ABQ1NXY7_9BACI|nr:RNA polymerase sigma factor SigX [Thalassobacillus devorans]NIK28347.1 RNA polymerase sigma-70 factor (ECF subfamily) [Thalassobacillus devorans]GGC87027.1 ECF RNA polymerase sigma factor SigX [Thalassobacillus devorans]